MTAHVADFGIARMISGSDSAETGSTSTLGVKGSMGYIAPEYGTGGQASTKGDVYSYGIMLLQMITGKSPTDDEFRGELNLPNWVQMLFPERAQEIVDRMVLRSTTKYELSQCVEPFIRIGLECSKLSPYERPTARDVARTLEAIKSRITFSIET
ncbi:hypothetical protein KI387_029180 [Taxus chinensis]|uniref:Protein kinase domain-containing protein n=1 Tax=Taxus chinensis TaxID=29808 RepID=A0AA38CIJ5_TAXCH|nr:hypothetical protein KI387_029180 [Taxus chinensis]